MFLRVWRPPGSSRASTHLPCTTLFRSDGGCLYFTFAAQVDPDQRDTYYRQAWDACTRAVLGAGGALSHHPGVGLNRSRFVAAALTSEEPPTELQSLMPIPYAVLCLTKTQPSSLNSTSAHHPSKLS